MSKFLKLYSLKFGIVSYKNIFGGFDMKSKLVTLVLAILLPLFIGALSGFIASDSSSIYESLVQPDFAPSGEVFPMVWTLLFLFMGISSYLVATSSAGKNQVKSALKIYGFQLVLNFFWSIIFFNFGFYKLGFFWIVFMLIYIGKTIKAFYPISKKAAYLLVPYFLWVVFAGVLNLAIVILN